MARHGRWIAPLAGHCLLGLLIATCGTIGRGEDASPALRNDAGLADVCFIHAKEGWAVGDRGTIWHTTDGGRTWEAQDSGVDCRLRSVDFIDANNGWVAGGFTQPLTLQSVGVLVRTRDGGKRWTVESAPLLPAIRTIRFLNGADGWAVGEPSALYPSGLFHTDNGGRSWSPLLGGAKSTWVAADFSNVESGALANHDGTFLTVQGRTLATADAPKLGLRRVRALSMADHDHGWAVGDGGLVLTTSDGGATWRAPASALPEESGDAIDWRALAVVGDHCWIAGSPGSRVLHSADGGQTWDVFATGQTLPIEALCFVDDRRGWAAGALGCISATTDGGRTWRPQRSGGTRAAVMGVYSQADEVPWELFSRLSGNDGYLSVIELLHRTDRDDASRPTDASIDHAHEALLGVGGCATEAAWGFPIRPRGIRLDAARIVADWDREHDGAGRARALEYVVGRIRCWRPDVIIAPTASPNSADGLAQLTSEVVLLAVEQASDPACFPEQIDRLGLAPWKTKKVFGGLAPGEQGAINLTVNQLAPRLGQSLADQAARSRTLVTGELAPPAATLAFQPLATGAMPAGGRNDLMSGLMLEPGCECRRALEMGPAESVDLLRRGAEQQRNIQSLVSRLEKTSASSAGLLGQVDDLIGELPPAEAGQILFRLAQRHHRLGEWALADEAFTLLAKRYPRHELTSAASRWLVQYESSGEVAWRVTGNSDSSERFRQAVEQAGMLERSNPVLSAEPSVRFPLATAQRQLGEDRHCERLMLALRRGRGADAWRIAADSERWLKQPTGDAPQPFARCDRAQAPPRLDGLLDDAVWQDARPFKLHGTTRDDADLPTSVWLARDDEYLYIAMRCQFAAGVRYATTAATRARDEDLSAQDRVELFFDLDRDRATWFHLTIDHRGWAAEDCWGDSTWNPQWFVASASTEGEWTAEAALPWSQMGEQPPQPPRAWAVGIQRTVPGAGFQSWSRPAALEPVPEGFGLLLFDD